MVPLAGLVIVTAPAHSEAFTETVSVSGSALTLNNLVGEVTVEPHSGSGVTVEVRVDGDDASRDRVRVVQGEGGDASSVVVAFPLDESRRYVYPKMRRSSRVNFKLKHEDRVSETIDDDVVRKQRGRRIEIAGKGSGLEIWADVTIRAPRDGAVLINVGAGDVMVTDMSGLLECKSHYGDVRVSGATGGVLADTGHGEIDLSGGGGAIILDTGNGDVSITDSEGTRVVVDTGNGDVMVRDVSCQSLMVDTGNGKVRASGVAAHAAELDTGNGKVLLELTEVGEGNYVVDTGNGSITLRLPASASAEVEANTGHGRVRLDLDERDIDIIRQRRDEVRFRMGDGAARFQLDSGNGSILIEV
jgi:hypothetical protein